MSEEKVIEVPIEQLQTFEGRCQHLYRIRSVDNKLIPFELTQSQEIMDDIIEEEFKRNLEENNIEEAKVIKLKCRQVGSTTYDAIRTLDELINIDMCNAITMAHNTDTTELIYDIIKRAYDNLPDAVIPTKDGEPLYTNEQGDAVSIKSKPTPKSYSGKRIAFEDNDSRSTIQTAGSKDDAIKGVTLNVLALSESANFPDLSTTLASGMPSLTHSGRKYISIESTANGVSGIGEDYYKLWNKSMQDWEDYKSGKTQTFQGFRPIFIPWYYIERYTKDLAGGKLTNIDQVDFGSPEGRKEYLEKEKRWTSEGVYNPLTEQMQVLTDEQLNWYRTMMKETAGYDYKKAMRYYPTTPEEAFVSSNHCFFDLAKLTELKTRYINGELPDCDIGEVDFNEDGHVVFKPQSDGYLKVWEHPDPNWENRYVAACLPEKESVVTDKGLKEVQEVNFNDKLINKDGDYVDIINKQVRKFDNTVYEFNIKNHYRTTKFTGEHPLLVSKNPKLKRNYNRSHKLYDWGERYWIHDFNFTNTKNVSEGDWIKYPNIYRNKTLSNKEITKKWEDLNGCVRYDFNIDTPILNEDFWWFVGMWLGDGWIQTNGRSKSIYLCFDKKDKKLQNKSLSLEKLFDRSVSVNIKDSTVEHKFDSKQLHKFLENNFGKYAHGKYISEWVKYLPNNLKSKLVEGYLNADGSIFEESRSKGKGKISFVSVSLNLLEDVQDIMFSLGYIGSINKLRDSGKSKIGNVDIKQKLAYQLSYGFYDTVNFLNYLGIEHNYNYKNRRTIKDSYFSKDLKYIYFKISKIKKEKYKGKVYNFECDTHTYLSRGITTHNCDVGRGYEDGDYTVIKVKDILTQKYVAQWKGRVDQPSAADIASMIGIYYNEALLVPESNLDTIVEIIKPDGLRPYIGEVYFNQSGSSVKWGYWTSGGNRNKMLDLYKEWLKDNKYGYEALPDIENVEQHITFVRHQTARGVKYEADTDCYDDIVMANALCHMGELWYDATPKEYNPKNIIQMVKRPVKKSIRRFKQSQIGK